MLSLHEPQSTSTQGLPTDLPKPLVTHADHTRKMFLVKNTFAKARASPRKSLVWGTPTFCQGDQSKGDCVFASPRTWASPCLPSPCSGGCSCTPILEPYSPRAAHGHCQQQAQALHGGCQASRLMLLRLLLGCGLASLELGFHWVELPQHLLYWPGNNGAFTAHLFTLMHFCAEGGIGCNYTEVVGRSNGWQESRAPRHQDRGWSVEEARPGLMSSGPQAGPGDHPSPAKGCTAVPSPTRHSTNPLVCEVIRKCLSVSCEGQYFIIS